MSKILIRTGICGASLFLAGAMTSAAEVLHNDNIVLLNPPPIYFQISIGMTFIGTAIFVTCFAIDMFVSMWRMSDE